MTRRVRLCTCLCVGLGSGSCYDATLDPDISGVFACEETEECGIGLQCIDAVCVATDQIVGPVIEIQSPPSLAAFRMGVDRDLSLILRGTNLFLTSDPNSRDPLAGYIDVYLDGVIQGTVFSGNLDQGLTVPPLTLPAQPGLHHIRVAAHRIDGAPFTTPQAQANYAFWVDDGHEHIGILEPAPASKVAKNPDGSVRVEVASLNFTFVNPGFVSQEETPADPEGYVSLYVDAQVPECLPACTRQYPQYQATLVPAGLSRVNRIAADQAVFLPDHAGTVKLQVVAQDIVHEPYSRQGSENDFVFHTVPIQPTAALE